MNLFYLPALLLMGAFIVMPLFNGVRLSFYKWNGYSANKTFIGLDNFISMFSDKFFRISFLNTILYGFGSTAIQVTLGLLYAVFLNSKFRGRNVVRTIIFIPVMISGLVMGYILYYFVQYNGGIFNEIIGWFGKEPLDWMADAVRGRIIITLINSWQFIGNTVIIYMAGLQGIPETYYEACAIDGGTAVQRMRYITLPMLLPSVSSAVILNLIGGLKLNDIIVSMTAGGPGLKTHSLSTYISYAYYSQEKAGYASAVGVFMFFFILIVTIFVNRYFRQKEAEMS